MAFVVELKRGCATTAVTRESFYAIVGSEGVKNTIGGIRSLRPALEEAVRTGNTAKVSEIKGLTAKLKKSLPGFCFQTERFEPHEWTDAKGANHGRAEWRHQEHVVLNGLAMCDFDHLDDPRATASAWLDAGLPAELAIMLIFVTPSGKGLKVIFAADAARGNLIDNQRYVAQRLGLQTDEACKDAARLSFTGTEADIIYIDEQLFTYSNSDYDKKYNRLYRMGRTQSLFGDDGHDGGTGADGQAAGGSSTQPDGAPEVQDAQPADGAGGQAEALSYTYNGLSVNDIIRAWLGDETPQEGNRHNTMLLLASQLRYVCDRNRERIRAFLLAQEWARALMSEDPVNFERTLDDAMKHKFCQNMEKRMAEAVATVRSKNSPSNNDAIYKRFREWGAEFDRLRSDYPCMKEVFGTLEPEMYPAAVFVSAAMFGTLMTRTHYHFYHNPEEERRLNYGIMVIGDPGSGKSFVKFLYDVIMSPIIASDAVGNDAINNYKRAVKERETSLREKKKEDVIKYPQVVIRIHGARTANGVFIEDMNNAVETVDGRQMHLHMFTFDSELDSATLAAKGGQWIDKTTMELKAFHNEEDNQQYRNNDSVSGPFNVYWNYVYTGTPLSLSRKVTLRNFGSGLFSRLAVLPIGGEDYSMMPLQKQSKKNLAQTDTLMDWASRLDKVHGELPLWPLVEVAWKWTDEMMEIARMENSKVISLLSKRVAYYGINVTAPFILMRHWTEWRQSGTFKIDDKDKAFCRLILEIQYYTQNYFFGAYAANYFDEQNNKNQAKTVPSMVIGYNFLIKLENSFKFEELMKVSGYTLRSASTITSRWIAEGLVTSTGRGKNRVFTKTKSK